MWAPKFQSKNSFLKQIFTVQMKPGKKYETESVIMETLYLC